MSKIAFVFSGQGAQYPGMGKSLAETSAAAKAVFDMADRVRPGTSEQCFNGTKEDLKETKNTQPDMFCVELAAAKALEEAGIVPDCLAGFSLGEITALTYSGAVTPEEGYRLVCRRGELMQEASERVDSAMTAVVKLTAPQVEELCARFDQIWPVNYNCPVQTVVAGLAANMPEFRAAVKEAGGKAIPLAVRGAFHSPFMEPAAQGLKEVLAGMDIGEPKIPLYSNATGKLYAGDYKDLLARQVVTPVHWQTIVEEMIASGVDTFIEAGPGKTLCNLIKKINDTVRAFNVEDGDSLRAAIEEVKGYA